MNGKQLKNSILQWAIQGKLVPQDPNDEPASVLLDKIRQEKERLIKEKKIKRDKNASIIYRGEDNSYYEKILATGEVKCIDEEIPFEIPQGWEWCRMGELISYQNGYAYTSSELNKEGKGLPVIKSGNLMTYEVVLKPNNDYVENPSTKMLASAIKKGDLLMCLSSQSDNPEPLGKTAIYKANNTALLNQRVLKMRPWLEDMLDYMYYAINSEYFHYTVSHQGGGSAQANLKLGHVLSMLIPLAPLKEEIRIVDKINTIMPLVHQYETTFLKQKKLNSELNERLKSAILQEAIQGKLIPQINEEGTAQELLEQIKTEKQKLVKEGKLKKSTLNDSVIFRCDDNKYYTINKKERISVDDEIPFDIPNTWEWCRLGTLFSHSTGKALNASNLKGQLMTYITTSNLYWDRFELDNLKQMRFTDEEIEKCTATFGDLLVCEGGDIGRAAIWNYQYDIRIQNHIHKLRAYKQLCTKFFFWLFYFYKATGRIGGKGIGIQGLSSKALDNILIPLPPLKEQQRIVAQIEKLFKQFG